MMGGSAGTVPLGLLPSACRVARRRHQPRRRPPPDGILDRGRRVGSQEALDPRWAQGVRAVLCSHRPTVDRLPGRLLRARSAPTLPAWNCGLLRTVTAGEKCLVSGPASMDRRSCSFTVCPAPSRPSQPLVAARLLPDANNGMRSLAMHDDGLVGPIGAGPSGNGADVPSGALRAIDPSAWP
jgi:hypothetical protein